MAETKLAAAIVAAVVTFACPALAQQRGICMKYEELRERFADEYAEYPVGVGLDTGSHGLTIILASESGTWTLVVANAQGWACATRAGTDWIYSPLPEPAPEERGG